MARADLSGFERPGETVRARTGEALNEALVGAEDVIVSDLALTEMASALGRRVRERRLAAAEARRLQREAERIAGACHHVELTPSVIGRAELLLLSSR